MIGVALARQVLTPEGGPLTAIALRLAAPLTAAYVVWAAVWVAMIWGLTASSFLRKDL